jgi:hypothetical protein
MPNLVVPRLLSVAGTLENVIGVAAVGGVACAALVPRAPALPAAAVFARVAQACNSSISASAEGRFDFEVTRAS